MGVSSFSPDLVALFGAINISGTGRIDRDEFADLFYHLELVVTDEYLNKLFHAADKDGKYDNVYNAIFLR